MGMTVKGDMRGKFVTDLELHAALEDAVGVARDDVALVHVALPALAPVVFCTYFKIERRGQSVALPCSHQSISKTARTSGG